MKEQIRAASKSPLEKAVLKATDKCILPPKPKHIEGIFASLPAPPNSYLFLFIYLRIY